MILNLCCGDNIIKGAINVDIMKGSGIDEIYDLAKTPWKWGKNSVEKIYLYHGIEHFPSTERIIKECHRILKKGGELVIKAPHSSSATAIGCLGHYRTFSYNTFKDYTSRNFYLFNKPIFKTEKQRIIWQPGLEWTPIQWLIDLYPIFFERVWCYWVGGAWEVQWTGRKL